ncbi:MAG TPA: hypothetical protein VK699_03595 [Terriglobales bacterium]|nr:hypothetical protein [Terriglobales bacterium]
MEGKLRKVGFYTTRFVDAQDEHDAEQTVLKFVKTELPSNSSSEDSTLQVESIEIVESSNAPKKMGTGFSFYVMD